MRLKIAVCDNEEKMRMALCACLQENKNTHSVVTFASGEALLDSREHFDVIFLDIDMEGINGIEVGQRIRKWDRQVYIVYVTHLSDYRKYAMAVHAFGYLEKPIKRSEIEAIVHEVMDYKKEEECPAIVAFKTEEGIKKLDLRDIYYFEYHNRQITLCSKVGNFQLKKKIGEVTEQMKPYAFVSPWSYVKI